MTKWLCQIKKVGKPLTEWDKRKLKEEIKNYAMAYNLEYIIVTKKD